MPKLKTTEIWKGREGPAALFKYELIWVGQPSILTWRATWDFTLERAPIIQSWEAVTLKYRGRGLEIRNESLDSGDIKSHSDAIHYLKLSELVMMPISPQQIRAEQSINGHM